NQSHSRNDYRSAIHCFATLLVLDGCAVTSFEVLIAGFFLCPGDRPELFLVTSLAGVGVDVSSAPGNEGSSSLPLRDSLASSHPDSPAEKTPLTNRCGWYDAYFCSELCT